MAATADAGDVARADRQHVDAIPRLRDEGRDVAGLPVKTNTQTERITGRYVTDHQTLGVGDDVYLVYGAFTERGGFAYSATEQVIVGRVVMRTLDTFTVRADFSGHETTFDLTGDQTTFERDGETYGIKHAVRRTDVTTGRRRHVKLYRALRADGLDVSYDPRGGRFPLTVKTETPADYRRAVKYANAFAADAECGWYRPDALSAEYGHQPAQRLSSGAWEEAWVHMVAPSGGDGE